MDSIPKIFDFVKSLIEIYPIIERSCRNFPVEYIENCFSVDEVILIIFSTKYHFKPLLRKIRTFNLFELDKFMVEKGFILETPEQTLDWKREHKRLNITHADTPEIGYGKTIRNLKFRLCFRNAYHELVEVSPRAAEHIMTCELLPMRPEWMEADESENEDEETEEEEEDGLGSEIDEDLESDVDFDYDE